MYEVAFSYVHEITSMGKNCVTFIPWFTFFREGTHKKLRQKTLLAASKLTRNIITRCMFDCCVPCKRKGLYYFRRFIFPLSVQKSHNSFHELLFCQHRISSILHYIALLWSFSTRQRAEQIHIHTRGTVINEPTLLSLCLEKICCMHTYTYAHGA